MTAASRANCSVLCVTIVVLIKQVLDLSSSDVNVYSCICNMTAIIQVKSCSENMNINKRLCTSAIVREQHIFSRQGTI